MPSPLLLYIITTTTDIDFKVEEKHVIINDPQRHWNWLLSAPPFEYSNHCTLLTPTVCPLWTAKISSMAPERTFMLRPPSNNHDSDDYPSEMIIRSLSELSSRLLSFPVVAQEIIPGRNPRHCPPWLAEALDSCFTPLPAGRQFPLILEAEKESYLAKLRSWNFTSLGCSVDEMMVYCWWIFVDLGLVRDTGSSSGNCSSMSDCSSQVSSTSTTSTTSSTSTNPDTRPDTEPFTHQANPKSLKRFLLAVSLNYCPSNPYHNLHHVVDVLQCCYYWLHELLPELLQSLPRDWIMAIALACLCHDLGHGSFGNAFLCRTGHPLTAMFGSRGVLEHQHAMLLCALLRQPSLDPLWGLDSTAKLVIRERVVECVMATDMSTHFEFIQRFRQQPCVQDDQLLIAVALVKCSDISNVCRPFPVALQWGHALLSEFLHQGDYERLLGLPLGPLNDRGALDVAAGQKEFLAKVAGPLYEAFGEKFPGIQPILTQMRQNQQEWSQQQQ